MTLHILDKVIRLVLTLHVHLIDLNRIIFCHIDIKIQRERKYTLFIIINNMKCMKHYIKSRFVKELQVCEFSETEELGRINTL